MAFNERANFERATFNGNAIFAPADFNENAYFSEATFAGDTWFMAHRAGNVHFNEATFIGRGLFRGAVAGIAFFKEARFQAVVEVALLRVADRFVLDAATFSESATVDVSAREVSFRKARFDGPATVHVRYANVDLTEARLTQPMMVASTQAVLSRSDSVDTAPEALLAFGRYEKTASILSLSGVNAGLLFLKDIDLSQCRFTGSFHLDQLHIEGNCRFADAPKSWWRTRRQLLVEEHYWRSSVTSDNPPPPRGWSPSPRQRDPDLGPAVLAGTYRQLRKALEDTKNEPDAADFYYGEMEMRRKDRGRPRGERVLLALYFLVSGYGLRASRALICLGVTMTAMVLALMMWGLPTGPVPPQEYTKVPLVGRTVIAKTYSRRPGGVAPGPWADKFSRGRAERAMRTMVNSAAFRSVGQGLTRPGTYIEMAARLVLPLLLLLTALAVRGRIKR